MAEAYCSKCKDYKKLVSCAKSRECEKCKRVVIHRCRVCEKEYEHYTSLLYHLNSTCNPQVRYECLKCDYKTYIYNTMQKHIRIHGISPWELIKLREKGNKIYKIVKFESDKKTQNGQIDNDNTRMINKNQANKRVTTTAVQQKDTSKEKSSIVIHNKNVKTNCPKCKKLVPNLKKHNIYCGIEATFGCKFCSYKSKYPWNLKIHVKRHLKDKMMNNKIAGRKNFKNSPQPNGFRQS